MVRITNARRPRIRPRSSLTPTARDPAGGRRNGGSTGQARSARRGAGDPAASVDGLGDRPAIGRLGRGSSTVGSVIAGSSGRFERRAVGCGDLEEELLEVARGPGEARRSAARRATDVGEQPRRRRVVAAEAELDRAVLEDRPPTRRPGRAANRSRAASSASPSASSRTRSTAPKRSRRSMSATRPWASTWPRSTIATLVHSSSSSGRMWLLMRIVLPSERSSRSSSRSSTRARGSRPEAGSSRSRTSGSWTSAWARQSRCCMPRDSVWTYWSRLSPRSTSSSRSPIIRRRPAAGMP